MQSILVRACFALLLLPAPLVAQTRVPAHQAVVSASVEKELASAGRAYVTVALRPVPYRDRTGLRRQMREVSDLQDLVLAALRDDEFELTYRYRTFAGLTGTVDRAGLEVLRNHPEVVRVNSDLRGHMVLDSSGVAIGADIARQLGVTGDGVTVAVLDGGIDTDHPDLLDDIAPGAWHFLQQGTNVGPGAEDQGGHGSGVSGIITSAGIVAPLGIAPDAEILPVKVIDPNGGWLSDFAAGIDYVVSVAGNYANLVAINMSLGSFQLFGQCPCDAQTPLLAAAANAATAAGITVFASSGNEGNCGAMSSPACVSSVVSVGAVYDADYGRQPNSGNYVLAPCFDATTAPNQVTCFTNRSACLDVAAPGRFIKSATIGGGTRTWTGTSFASPHLAAVAALLGEVGSFTPDELMDLIRATGHPTTDPGCSVPSGLVRVDVVSALCEVAPELASSVTRGLAKISDARGGFGGGLADDDQFGLALASVGDLDGDGVEDLAVGAPGDDTGGTDRGALWILFLEDGGRVRSEVRIASGASGFLGALADGDAFGSSVANLGDLDGDGRPEVAVGAPGDDTGGVDRGALWLVSLYPDGTVAAEQRIADGSAGLVLSDGDALGTSLAALADLDGNGTVELGVGAETDDDGGTDRGALWVLFLDGASASASQKISSASGGLAGPLGDGDKFGRAITSLGDLGGDGAVEVAVGAFETDDAGTDTGAVWILSLDAGGMVVAEQKVSASTGGLAAGLDDGDRFGASLGAPGDVSGDGIADLLVGAVVDDDGGRDRGAVYLLELAADGTVTNTTKISSRQCALATRLRDDDRFGRSIAVLGRGGRAGYDLAVGAFLDDDGGTDRGAVWLTNLIRRRVLPTGAHVPTPTSY